MSFCPFCGTPVKEQHKFCPSCGNVLEPVAPRQGTATQQPTPPPVAYALQPAYPLPPAAQPAYQPTAQPTQEPIRVIIPNLMVSKSLGRVDTYNLIVTDRRSIFVKLTNEIMGEAVKMRRAKAGAEGKGFFGKWKVQMQGFNTYTDWYQDKTPDYALSETPGNWAVDNSAIGNIKVNEDSGDEGGMTLYYVEITTMTGKLNFKMQYDPKELFQRAYGSR